MCPSLGIYDIIHLKVNSLKGGRNMKHIRFIPVLVAFTFLISLTPFAAAWQSNEQGWWYLHDDGTYPVSTWEWIDGNDDGIAECYYFDANGYCLMNTQAPDGSYVDTNGAWIENGVVQTLLIMDKSMRTSYPSNIPISIGTSLNEAINVFNTYQIGYQTEPTNVNSYFYCDNEGYYNSYGFNLSGKCDTVAKIYYTGTNLFIDQELQSLPNLVTIPLVSHINNDVTLEYTFQSEDKNTVLIAGRTWNNNFGLYQVYIHYAYYGAL